MLGEQLAPVQAEIEGMSPSCAVLTATGWHFPGDVLPAPMGQAEGSEGSCRLWRLKKGKV